MSVNQRLLAGGERDQRIQPSTLTRAILECFMALTVTSGKTGVVTRGGDIIGLLGAK